MAIRYRWLAVIIILFGSITTVSAEVSGRDIFLEYCHICHGTGMPDVPQFGDGAHWQARKEKGMEALYNAAIYGVNAMPPMGLCEECSEEQIKAAVDYMVTSSH
jgi:cytochrome c5